MRFFITILLLSLFLSGILGGCKKESQGNSDQPDCQANNYGIYRVNFASGTITHAIIVFIGFGSREKGLAPGTLTDTFHLAPGTYSVLIVSNNGMGGPAINTDNSTASIEQCKEFVKSIPF